MKHKKVNIGSVSSGTMRPEDLIPDFIWELRQQTPTRCEHLKLCADVESAMRRDQKIQNLRVCEYWESMRAHSDLDNLFNALEEYALPYMYFGSHPGDGADYGFWVAEGMPEEFEGLQVSDLSEVPARHCGEVLVVSDHGNMSLYTRGRNYKLTEVWSLV